MTGAKNEVIYFMGIGGTGMASVAGLLKQAGYTVAGSDAGVYPPMSDVLAAQNIEYATPYAPSNLETYAPSRIVVANVLSRGHEELEEAIKRKIPLTSFPAILKDTILKGRKPVVVCGTHGKTTTTTIMTHLLKKLGDNPGYLIGGLPRGLENGFDVGKGSLFLLEGDEYDTAYFDKESKFFHYMPEYVIFNNVEFDHADIFDSLDKIDESFVKFLKLVHNPSNIIANIDDEGVQRVLKKAKLDGKVTDVSGFGNNDQCHYCVNDCAFDSEQKLWSAKINVGEWGELSILTPLSGTHNMSNIAQTLALLHRLVINGEIPDPGKDKIQDAYRNFGGVARRLDLLADKNDILVYEDFAHHPTAVRLVLQSLKKMFPKRRILVGFEPKNATSRRNVFQEEFASSLSVADRVFVGKCPDDHRLSDDEKMDTSALAQAIGAKAQAFKSNEALLANMLESAAAEDVVVFMSPGSFSGIQHQFVSSL